MTSTATKAPPAPGSPELPPTQHRRRELPPWPVLAGIGVLVLAGLILRFFARQALWLDESQSVAIARLPLHGSGVTLIDGLKQDGSPPLYYLLLHGWIQLFGSGTAVVRGLSALLNLIALPPLYLLARRVVGERPAKVVVLLYLCSPYAIYYSTETRMYSLVILLTVLYGLALERTIRRASVLSVLAVGVMAAALALTHYWCIYLLMTMSLVLVFMGWRRHMRGAWLSLLGHAFGAALLIPWVPTLLYQLKHTGTPWGDPASLSAVIHAYGWWSGGPTTAGRLAFLVVAPLIAFAVCGRAVSTRSVLLEARTKEPGLLLLVITTGTLIVAIGLGQLTGSAYADRYTATAFVPFLLLTAIGTTVVLSRKVLVVAIGFLALLGVVAGAAQVLKPRTQASQAASTLAKNAKPGDVVLVCPDQLGPALRRLAPTDLRYYAVPTFTDPQRVDWVDYKQRNESADPVAIVRRAEALAGPDHAIYLVNALAYKTYEQLCPAVQEQLRETRQPGSSGFFLQKPDMEGMEVDVFPGPAAVARR